MCETNIFSTTLGLYEARTYATIKEGTYRLRIQNTTRYLVPACVCLFSNIQKKNIPIHIINIVYPVVSYRPRTPRTPSYLVPACVPFFWNVYRKKTFQNNKYRIPRLLKGVVCIPSVLRAVVCEDYLLLSQKR